MERRKQVEMHEKMETMLEQNQQLIALMTEVDPRSEENHGGPVFNRFARYPQPEASPVNTGMVPDTSAKPSQHFTKNENVREKHADINDDDDVSEDSIDPFALDDSEDGLEEGDAPIAQGKLEPLTVLEQLKQFGIEDMEGVNDLDKLLESEVGDEENGDDDSENGDVDLEEQAKIKREEKDELKKRLEKDSKSWKFKPAWRHREDGNRNPHPNHIMKAKSIFRATAITIFYLFVVKAKVRRKFERLRETKKQDINEVVDLVATYSDRVRTWLATAVRIPVVSVATDRSLNLSILSVPEVYGVPQRMGIVLKFTSAIGFETDRPKNIKAMQLMVIVNSHECDVYMFICSFQ